MEKLNLNLNRYMHLLVIFLPVIFSICSQNRVNPGLVNADIRIPALHFREQTCIVGSVTYYCPVYADLLFRLRT